MRPCSITPNILIWAGEEGGRGNGEALRMPAARVLCGANQAAHRVRSIYIGSEKVELQTTHLPLNLIVTPTETSIRETAPGSRQRVGKGRCSRQSKRTERNAAVRARHHTPRCEVASADSGDPYEYD